MKGQMMFNYPRKIYSLDFLKKESNRVAKFQDKNKKELFVRWLHQYKIMASIHQGDAYAMTLIDCLDVVYNSMLEYKRDHCFHEKHNAWVICRPAKDVNLGGGSHFYPQRFQTEEECLKYIKENF